MPCSHERADPWMFVLYLRNHTSPFAPHWTGPTSNPLCLKYLIIHGCGAAGSRRAPTPLGPPAHSAFLRAGKGPNLSLPLMQGLQALWRRSPSWNGFRSLRNSVANAIGDICLAFCCVEKLQTVDALLTNDPRLVPNSSSPFAETCRGELLCIGIGHHHP